MKKIYLILCLFFIYTISVNGQSYNEYIKETKALYKSGDFHNSTEKYSKAFLIKEGNASNYYNAACSAALAKDSVLALNYLNLSANKGLKSLEHIKKDNDLKILHSSKDWTSILEKIEKNLNEYEKDLDKPLKKKLEQILIRDQTLRLIYLEAEKKFKHDSENMKYIASLMAQQDSINEHEVINIIEHRGWVGKSLVGNRANTALWIVIQHAPLEIQEKYLPLLEESVKKGESKGEHLALLKDRILMRNGKPQIYGSQIIQEGDNPPHVYKIENPEYVNKRRKEIGLSPIEDYVKKWGITWGIEQKE